MTVDESLSGLLRRLDLEVCASIYAMDLALDDMDEIELGKATARYKAYKATYDHFRTLFPNVTY